MAFKLNVQGTYRKAARAQSTAERIVGARRQVRFSQSVGYFESPRMHMMSAILMFLMGVSLASLRIQLTTHHDYDMTPTGSIAASALSVPVKKSCD